jgi:hypothetical protein
MLEVFESDITLERRMSCFGTGSQDFTHAMITPRADLSMTVMAV